MNDIHPHWNTSEENTHTAHKHPHASSPARVQIAASSPRFGRRIAALTGCLLVFGLGLSLAWQFDRLPAQVMKTTSSNSAARSSVSRETPVRVRITDNGIIPGTVSVLPGQTIIWKNDTTIPHILESEDLIDQSGSLLYTPAIFPNAEEQFVVSSEIETGQYSYESTTSSTIQGFVVIIEDPSAPPAPKTQSTGPVLQPSTTMQSSSAQMVVSAGKIVPPAPTKPPSQEAMIPVNPYTVEGGRDYPFDAEGNPIEERFETSEMPPAARAHQPVRQPSTGSEVWIVILASIAAFAFATKRYLVRA